VEAHELMRALAASGVFVAVAPTGLWLLQQAVGTSLLNGVKCRWALAVPIGVAAWSMVLVALAQFGWFRPAAIGAAAWAVACAAALPLRGGLPAAPLSRHGVVAAAALAALGWLYAGFPNESLLGDRDEGLYTLMAMLLQRTGALAVGIPEASALAPELLRPLDAGRLGTFFLPGIYQTPSGLQLQFPPLLPVWAAQLAAATLGKGLFSASAIASLAAVPVFHVLARQFMRPQFATVATIVFALNPASIWIARVNLVEPLVRLLVLGGLLASVIALKRRSTGLALVAAALLGLAAFARLDLLLVAPLGMGFAALVHMWRSTRLAASLPTAIRLSAAIGACQGAAVALLLLISPGYVQANSTTVLAALVAVLLATAVFAAARSGFLAPLAEPTARRGIGLAVVVALFALLAYAALLRPQAEPFALIDRPGSELHGTRDFRERSLLNLAAYLSWPVVLSAAFGAAVVVRRLASGRGTAAMAFAATLFACVSVVVLANPRISPDHFWAVRRFVPIVIPGFALLAGYGLHTLLGRRRGVGVRRGIYALAAVAAAWLLVSQRATLFVNENEGLTAQMQELDAALGDASVVLVRDLDALAGTLFLGYGRPVLPIRDSAAGVNESARALWRQCSSGSPCRLVHADHRGLVGLRLGESRPALFERRLIARTPLPLPRSVTTERSAFFVTPVWGLESERQGKLFGAYRNWNVDERGFYGEDVAAGALGRWTGGDATVRFRPVAGADTLEIRLMVPGPGPRRLRIELDGQPLQDSLAEGPQRLSFALGSTAPDAWRELRMVSETFNPRAAGLSDDGRDLGVWVQAIRLIDSRAPRIDASLGDAAFRSRVEVVGGPIALKFGTSTGERGALPVVSVSNEGQAVWPGGAEVAPGEVPVALGAKWRRAGSAEVLLEQRFGLPFALRPGERILMAVDLAPTGPSADGRLKPGDYEIELDMVQDGVTWFAARGSVAARLQVRLAAGTAAAR
jgi:hypothetical protein